MVTLPLYHIAPVLTSLPDTIKKAAPSGRLLGVPERIRTADLPLRRRTLYPAELRKHLLYPTTHGAKIQPHGRKILRFCRRGIAPSPGRLRATSAFRRIPSPAVLFRHCTHRSLPSVAPPRARRPSPSDPLCPPRTPCLSPFAGPRSSHARTRLPKNL